MNTARAHELPTLLDRAPEGLRYLSLDCFDTLLWRDTNAPTDVFADLDLDGGAIQPRRRAESAARRAVRYDTGGTEVSIEAIHARFNPVSDGAAADSVVAELDAEARHCFGFAPVIALIGDARAKGLGVVIVSDTYLSEVQLRALIGAAAGEQVLGMIDHVFCSSEHGMSKVQGLFGPVLTALDCAPEQILHVGDNLNADHTAPTALGITAVHFVQFDEEAGHRLRLEAAIGAVLDPRIRASLPAWQPHRAAVSLRTDNDPALALGHDVLGPLFVSYAEWLQGEVAALAATTGRKTHLLFLLRDGYLPARVHGALYGEDVGGMVEISRMAAMRASFRDEAAIRRHLSRVPPGSEARSIAKQLLFNVDEIAKLAPVGLSGMARAFVRSVMHPANVAKIVTRSARFAERLIAHLERAGVAQGDAVVFADLGYNGSAQNLVEPVLRERMGLHVAGRYLVLREDSPSGHDKAGYFDTRTADFRVLDAICGPISLLEQLCTKAQGSVVDYKANGEPVRATESIKTLQSATRDAVQAACVAYAKGAHHSGPISRADGPEARRIAATGLLGRLLFLPSHAELGVLEAFEHDFNCGSNQQVKLIDPAASQADLRRRGLLYTGSADRMFLPGEFRRNGLPLNLSFLVTSRFGLDFKGADFKGEPIKLPVILMDHRGQAIIDADAWATHDGYYAATVPVGRAAYSAAISWGQLYDYVELEEMSFHRVSEFAEASPDDHAPILATIIPDAMEGVGGNLYRCQSANAFTLMPPPVGTGDDLMLLSIVFRPIVRRDAAVPVRAAA
jgi:FMN phosphatase YigB (HAD superfamily)